jgi:hypothetical protein
MEKTE